MRRHVAGASIAYVVGSWVLIQVADVLAPAFGAPDWTIRAITTMLILLFPMFVVFAWEFDITRGGIERTTDDRDRGFSATSWFRRSLVGLISLASIGSIWWVWNSGFMFKPVEEFPLRIAVASFQAFTGSEESDWIGEGIAALVRDNLAQSDKLQVTSLRRWRAVRDTARGEDVLEAANDAGIRYLIDGELIRNRSGHILTVRLSDTIDGERLDGWTFEVTDETSLLERATAIAQSARALLNIPAQERVDVFAADFAAENPSAYRAFVGALDYWVNFEFSEAKRLLQAALKLQPDYAMANYYLAWILAVEDRTTLALATLERAATARNISQRDKRYIEALSLLLQRDSAAADAYAGIVDRNRSDTEALYLYAEALEHAGNDAAALEQYERLAQLEPEVHHGWSGMAYVNRRLGNYPAANDAIERFAELAPDNPNVYVLRADVSRAEGRLEEAIADYQLAIEKGPELQEGHVSLGVSQYLIGKVDAALATLDGIVRDDEAIPRYRIDAAFQAGGILNGLGRFSDHAAYLGLLEPELRQSANFHAKAQADQATARLLAGSPYENVRELIADSVANSPGVPTRYLFARALGEIAAGDSTALAATVDEIRGHALPPDDPDRTEDKAADYLQGVALLAGGDHAAALPLLQSAVELGGYAYRRYEVDYAGALMRAGRPDDAVAVLAPVLDSIGVVDPRLDLEFDRHRAAHLLLALYRQQSRASDIETTRALHDIFWQSADESHFDVR